MPFVVMLIPTTESPDEPRRDIAVHDTIVREGAKPDADGVTFKTTDGTTFDLKHGDFYLSRLSPSLCRIIFSAAQGTNSWIATPSGSFLKAKGSVGQLPDYGAEMRAAGLPPDRAENSPSEQPIAMVDAAALCGRLQTQLVRWDREVRSSQAAGLMHANEQVRMPPADPGTEERLKGDPSGVAARCAASEAAGASALKESVLATVVSRNPEWGIVWRADVVTAAYPDIVSRRVCTLTPSGERRLLLIYLPLDKDDPGAATEPLRPDERVPAK